tara:strand:+ start:193 stop:1386 length:1194 start_codon:yes stop_codon:yes gene_type:complete
MSRILRRPMFRGGRVDARGTGIASGLGYAGGGSVQNRPGYDTGGTLTDPQAVIEARRLGILKTPTWLDETFRKKYYLDEDVAYQGIPITGMQGMIEAEAGVDLEGNPTIDEGGILDETRNLILKGDKKGTAEDYTQFFKEKFDKNYETEIDEQKKGLEAAGELEKLALFGDDQKVPEEGETREQFEERIRRENAEELQTLIESQMSKGTPEEEIEKNKKIFQKAYGSGVADDASSMLLNFAGKALKPEATVKSAFGEFFEAEGKRPSERKKYKDAATTAAINAYLTGQTSFKKFQDQLALTKAGVDYQLLAKQPKTLNEAFTKFLKTGDDATDPGIMSQAVEAIYGVGSFEGKLLEDQNKLIKGKVYYADDPNNKINKVLFLIDESGNPNPIKTVYK